MRGNALVCIGAGLALLAGTAGAAEPAAKYDSLVLSLSWSPTWCAGDAGKSDASQCGAKKFGFIVHGLWPQKDKGANPAKCDGADEVPDAVAAKIQAVMPSRKLIDGEWRRHGTCFGGDAAAYFTKVKAAWDKLTIPPAYAAPAKVRSESADAIRQAFVTANSGLPADAVRVTCRKKRGDDGGPERLAEVRICLDRDLKFHPCPGKVRDTCKGPAQVLPVK